MRGWVAVVLLVICAGLLSLSSCVAQRGGFGADWKVPPHHPTRPAEPDGTGLGHALEYRPEVLNVGPRPLVFAAATWPSPTRTIAVEPAPPPLPVTTPLKHVVTPGETLIGIARQRLGDERRWREIMAANPGLESGSLKAGQTLNLPR